MNKNDNYFSSLNFEFECFFFCGHLSFRHNILVLCYRHTNPNIGLWWERTRLIIFPSTNKPHVILVIGWIELRVLSSSIRRRLVTSTQITVQRIIISSLILGNMCVFMSRYTILNYKISQAHEFSVELRKRLLTLSRVEITISVIPKSTEKLTLYTSWWRRIWGGVRLSKGLEDFKYFPAPTLTLYFNVCLWHRKWGEEGGH